MPTLIEELEAIANEVKEELDPSPRAAVAKSRTMTSGGFTILHPNLGVVPVKCNSPVAPSSLPEIDMDNKPSVKVKKIAKCLQCGRELCEALDAYHGRERYGERYCSKCQRKLGYT
jgi:hypothetical protein